MTLETKKPLDVEESSGSLKSPGVLERLYSKLVVDTLLAMKKGSLEIIMPDGSRLDNGSFDQTISCTINIHSYNFFKRCITYGAIGFAESYIDAEWSSPDLTDVIRWFIFNGEESTVMDGSSKKTKFLDLFNIFNRIGHLLRPNTKAISKKNIQDHYDLSNDLFKLFLDPGMTYSSAIFEPGELDLEGAQFRKYDRLASSLSIEKGDQVLEIGCGWGAFACHVARNYGARVTGITISEEQFDYACRRVIEEGLEELVEIRLMDYRDLEGKFDKIASIEMVEALGDDHVDRFFSCCDRLLKQDGVLAIQMISSPGSRYDELKSGVDFIQKHIFPGSLLLSLERVVKATRTSSNLDLINLFEFPESYAKTLNLWSCNFEKNLDSVRELGFSEQFIRKWFYYFSYCEAAFDMRQISVVQFVMARPNNLKLREKRSL